jgi:hypothetical protein
MNSTSFDDQIQLLKKHIEFKCGFSLLAYHDCKLLAELLKREKINISPLTISRIFNILGGIKRPYTSTLDLLAKYVGYSTYSNFIYDCNNSAQNWLFGPDFKNTHFSILALELAIEQADWDSVKLLLDVCNPHQDDYDFPMFLGNAVRNHPLKKEFLNALMDVEVGRIYFFERFVDEDDPGGYFSNSLSSFYANYRRDAGSMIFKTCFQLSKQIYNYDKFEHKDWRNMN